MKWKWDCGRQNSMSEGMRIDWGRGRGRGSCGGWLCQIDMRLRGSALVTIICVVVLPRLFTHGKPGREDHATTVSRWP